MTLIMLSILAIYVGIGFNEQIEKFLPEPKSFTSTFNKKPSGLSGLKELAGKVGLAAHTWQLPYRQLANRHGTLVVFQPEVSFRPFEAEQILEWVKSGNQLIYFDEFAFQFERRLINKLGVDAIPGKILQNNFVKGNSAHPEFSYVGGLTVTAQSRLTGGSPLLSDESGALISEVKHGKGYILLGVMPSLCANRQLISKGSWPNFQFMINSFRTTGGELLFDEFCHGYSQASNVFIYLAKGPVGLVLMQLLIVFLLAITSSFQRFGSIKTLTQHRKISNLEFINGLASTYRRAKANGLVAEVLAHNCHLKLCKALGVSS
ncbi:MAG: DUF4350 domain-containing protein, partial [Candidatus Melainabacteria bacterium]|nr:DUF4350 domain-containing protein [Candidatus Melainabacteria bacterium]